MVFKEDEFKRADWLLLRDGAVTLFWSTDIYSEAISSLKELDYNILNFSYNGPKKFYEDFSVALKWKEQFGYSPWTGNLDAFNDGLREEPLNSSKDSAICIENFHHCVKEDPQWAQALLDILETQSRHYLLTGQCLIVLIQTDDPNYYCENLGGRPSNWNRAEWMTKDRGL